jgi:periplasmic protein TonB
MSYQALLFCPEEKTARTVTQVLGELDFSVVPCTEPFGAVKKLMGERFDAVVVDCDNEQNATLLFKSARSAPNNQGALAVAVVEGQAGVAKAFRIGANLVLTKPINVEQAKGTLRVARGLLRKNEGAKAAGAAASISATKVPTSTAANPVARAASPSTALPASAAVSPMVAARVIRVQNPAPQPAIAASAPSQIAAPAESEAEAISMGEPATEAPAPIEQRSAAVSSRSSVPVVSAASKASATAERSGSSGFTASAAAPARDVKPSAAVGEKSSAGVTHVLKPDPAKALDLSSASAPTLTFGGMVGTAKPASNKRGGKKGLLIAVALGLIAAAGGYAAWTMKWNPLKSLFPAPAPAPTRRQPATIPAGIQADASTPNPISASPSSENQTSETAVPEAQKRQAVTEETPAPTKAAKPAAHKVAADAGTGERPSAAAEEESALVATSAAPDAIKINNDHPKPAAKTAEGGDAPALSITATAGSGGTLPNLMGPSNTPTPVLQKLVVSQGVSRGLLIKQVQPVYPRAAIDMHTEGAVEIMATVSKNGNISEAKVLSGDKQLAQAAIEAVKQWKYKPYLLNGEPVDIQTQITVNFKLPQQ